VILTKSRGALLALLAIVFFALRHRLGRTLSLMLAAGAALALIAMGITKGRSLSMDASSEGRVDAWAGGLQMLQGSPIWGVGFSQFGEVNGLAAHNSFVNCFSETGFVGYFLWSLLVVLTMTEAAALSKRSGEDEPGAELAPWGRAVFLSLAGFLTAAFFLSRTYSSVLFLLLGLGAALSDIARRQGFEADETPLFRWVPRIVGLEVGTVILVKAMVVVLG
jgi:O-antigen ligase